MLYKKNNQKHDNEFIGFLEINGFNLDKADVSRIRNISQQNVTEPRKHITIGFLVAFVQYANQFVKISIDDMFSKNFFAKNINERVKNTISNNKVNIACFSLEDILKSEKDNEFEELWIILNDLDLELHLMDNYPDVFYHNWNRGVKYTYFLSKIEEAKVRRFKIKVNQSLYKPEIYKLPQINDDPNFIAVPYNGISIYEPNNKSTERKGYEEHQFYGMSRLYSFQMHDDEVEELVYKLRKIKNNKGSSYEF